MGSSVPHSNASAGKSARSTRYIDAQSLALALDAVLVSHNIREFRHRVPGSLSIEDWSDPYRE